jgi:hypothetical protein
MNLLPDLSGIRHKKSAVNAVEHMRIPLKSVQRRLQFSDGCKWIHIRACTVKRYGIFRVKKVLLNALYYVTVFTICYLATQCDSTNGRLVRIVFRKIVRNLVIGLLHTDFICISHSKLTAKCDLLILCSRVRNEHSEAFDWSDLFPTCAQFAVYRCTCGEYISMTRFARTHTRLLSGPKA